MRGRRATVCRFQDEWTAVQRLRALAAQDKVQSITEIAAMNWSTWPYQTV
jgi:hypothetical protein